MLKIERPRIRLPKGPVEFNRSHPLWSRIAVGVVPSVGIDAWGNVQTGVRTLSVTSEGLAAAGGSGNYITGSTQRGIVGRNAGGTIWTHHHTVVIIAHDVGDGWFCDNSGSTLASLRVASGQYYHNHGAVDMFASAGATVPTTGRVVIGAYVGQWGGNQPTVRINGTTYTGSNASQDSWAVPNYITWFGSSFYPTANTFNGKGVLALVFKGQLTDEEIDEIGRNPQHLFAPRSIPFPVSAGGGGTTHAATGVLAGAGGAIDGTAARTRAHPTTGVLAGGGGAITGTAAHIAIHGTSGVLAGSGATVDGAAARTRDHPTTGVLAGGGGAITGTAAHIAIHGTSGTLAGSGGTIDGAAARTRAHPTSGVLAGAGGVIDGAADHVVPGATHDTSGALAGGGGAIDGTAAHVAIHGTSGALVGGGGAVVGTAQNGTSTTTDLILKILANRQELNPATGTFTLYDNDGTTVLYTTNAWADAAGTVPYSGGALRRIDALF